MVEHREVHITEEERSAHAAAGRETPVGAGPAAQGSDGARVSLREQAYEAIKHAIITCALRPGEYINESLLSARLKVGRTPVRQAIDQLQQQGLVDIIPRKGTMVRPIHLHDIVHVTEVRMINEVECARMAASRATKSDLSDLRSVLAKANGARKQRDIEVLMKLDREFHGLIAQAARNPVLAELLRTLHERSLRVWFLSLNDAEHLKSVQKEHEAILAALVAGNADAAGAAMRGHIQSYRGNIARYVGN